MQDDKDILEENPPVNPFNSKDVDFFAEASPNQPGGAAESFTRKPVAPIAPEQLPKPQAASSEAKAQRTERPIDVVRHDLQEEGSKEVERPEPQKQPEQIGKAPLDAVVVCGMGPLSLDENLRMQLQGRTDRLFPNQPYMRINANAAKLLAAHGIIDTVIMSGRKTAKPPPEEVPVRKREKTLEQKKVRLQKKATGITEAELLADTFDRMRGKNISQEGRERAAKILEIDPNAATTFDNIIQALNMMDKKNNGYWEGKLGVLSAEFHSPRLKEMIDAFGINAIVLAAEQVHRQYGYNGRLYPSGDFGFGVSYEDFEEGVYKSQPAGLQNLQDNPAYVTFELAKVESDQRLQQMATNLRNYYTEKGVTLPDVYSRIPDAYNPAFDYKALRAGFSAIPFSKHGYQGELSSTQPYRQLAHKIAEQTTTFLQSVSPPTNKIQ